MLRRKKIGSGRVSLYLDLYQGGVRQYDFPNLYLTSDKDTNKETLRLARSITAKRQLEIQSTEHGFILHFKRKANFVEYFEELTKDRKADKQNWECVLKSLEVFTKRVIPFSGITEQWVEDYKAFLLSRLKPDTASFYFAIIKGSLSKSVRDPILLNNPAAFVKRPRGEDVARSFLLSDELNSLAKASYRNLK